MKIGYSYQRFSDKKQRKGDSRRRQTAFEQEVCREKGLTLDDSLDLSDEGKPAFRGQNVEAGALGRFLDAAENGEIQTEGCYLLIENIDRLSRLPPMRALRIFQRIIELGLTVITASPRAEFSRQSLDDETSSGIWMLVSEMQRAHNESKRKSVLVGKAWEGKRKRAREEGRPMTGICPAWLKVEKGRYVVVEDRAKVVRLIFELAGEGMGARRIAAKLTAGGVKPMGRTGEWNKSYVKKILTNPAVYGEAQHQVHQDGKQGYVGEPIPDFYPSILSKEEFELSRARMKARKWQVGRTAKGEGSLVKGLVWHAGDRAKMHFRMQEGRPQLESAAVDNGQRALAARRFPYKPFEDAILDALHELRPEDVSAKYRERKSELDAKAAELEKRIELDEARLAELTEEHEAEENAAQRKTLLGMIRKATGRLEEAREELGKTRAEADATRTDNLEQTRALIELLRNTPAGPERETLRRRTGNRIRSLVEAVWVHIEQMNRQRRYAHVQIFLKAGGMRYFVVPALKLTPTYRAAPQLDFDGVDLRTHVLTNAEKAVGKGKTKQYRPRA